MIRNISQAVRAIESNSSSGSLTGYAFLLRRILKGDAAALDTLGSMFTYGVGVEPNPVLAAACYHVASAASDPGGTYNLASAMLEGAGMPKDVKGGIRLLRNARRAGNAVAANYLGFCYRVGEGVPKDPERGFSLTLEAATAGVAAAQYDAGMCLLTGTGVGKDPVAARRWISRAARGGDRNAQEYLGRPAAKGRLRKRTS